MPVSRFQYVDYCFESVNKEQTFIVYLIFMDSFLLISLATVVNADFGALNSKWIATELCLQSNDDAKKINLSENFQGYFNQVTRPIILFLK